MSAREKRVSMISKALRSLAMFLAISAIATALGNDSYIGSLPMNVFGTMCIWYALGTKP